MKIEKLKKNNYKLFSNYLLKNYNKNHIFLKSKKLFDWQYLCKKNYNFYIIKKKKKIVAIQGFIPLNYYDNSLLNDGYFLSLWSSSAASYGSKLFFEFQKKIKKKILIGLGSSKQSFTFQKMLNFNCGYFDHYFLTSEKKKKNLISPKNFSNFKKTKNKINFELLKNEKQIRDINSKVFYNQIPKKSQTYLINRYFRHPVYTYYIYSLKIKKKEIGIFVFRICNFKSSNALRIVDFIGSNESFSKGKYLFKFALKNYNAEYIDLYSVGLPQKFLSKSGLENINKYKNIKIIIPNYFEPFFKKNIALPYAYKNLVNTRKVIRLFKGDSDLDRPNLL